MDRLSGFAVAGLCNEIAQSAHLTEALLVVGHLRFSVLRSLERALMAVLHSVGMLSRILKRLVPC